MGHPEEGAPGILHDGATEVGPVMSSHREYDHLQQKHCCPFRKTSQRRHWRPARLLPVRISGLQLGGIELLALDDVDVISKPSGLGQQALRACTDKSVLRLGDQGHKAIHYGPPTPLTPASHSRDAETREVEGCSPCAS